MDKESRRDSRPKKPREVKTIGQTRIDQSLSHPPGQVVLDILVDQKGHPRRRHDSDDARHKPPIEPPDPFLPPGLADHAPDAASEVLVGLVVLQTAAQDLVRVRDGPGDELGGAGEEHGGLGRERRGGIRARGRVHALGGFVDGELDGAVGDADEGDGQAAVEAPQTLGSVDVPRAGRHGRVRALGGPVAGEHAGLDDPDRVREGGGDDAGDGRGEEVVARGGVGAAAEDGEGSLGARLEEEEGSPGRRVADEVGR